MKLTCFSTLYLFLQFSYCLHVETTVIRVLRLGKPDSLWRRWRGGRETRVWPHNDQRGSFGPGLAEQSGDPRPRRAQFPELRPLQSPTWSSDSCLSIDWLENRWIDILVEPDPAQFDADSQGKDPVLCSLYSPRWTAGSLYFGGEPGSGEPQHAVCFTFIIYMNLIFLSFVQKLVSIFSIKVEHHIKHIL